MDVEALSRTVSFPTADRTRWLALVEKALAGASYAEAMVARTDDGIAIDPLAERRPDAAALPRREPLSPWIVVQRCDDPDPIRANSQALDDVENGATGLSLVFEGAPNAFGYGLPATPEALDQVLAGIALNRVHLRADAHPSSRAMADHMVAFLTRKRVDPGRLSLSFGLDSAAVFAGTGRLRMSIEALQASMPQSLAHFFAHGVPGILLEADGRVYHNAGATEAQELGAMLAGAVGHLRLFAEARQALVYAAPHIGFALCVDQDFFLSIAKIRALRLLWQRAQELCAIPPSPATIHAETSYRMTTLRDPETNVLRATLSAFAAGCGGADSLAVLPHTIAHGLPDASARRLARNVQLVLREESHVDFVADPARGSGAVEALTQSLCEAAWAEFQAIEREGGLLKSLLDGRLQDRIEAARSAGYAARGGRIVGTSVYAAATERAVSTLAATRLPLPTDGSVFCRRLDAARIDETAGTAA